MNPSAFSIRSLLLALLVAVILPLVALLALTIYADASHGIDKARASVRTLAKIIAANTSRTLTANREALDTLAQRPLMRAVDGKRCDPILAEFHSIFPRFANLTTIDMNGLAVCSAVPQPGGKPVDISRTEWFERALKERRFLAGNPFVGPITGKWVSVLVSPIRDERQQIKGFMGLPLDLSAFDPNIAAAPLPAGTRYGLISMNGRMIWRNQDPEKLLGKDAQDLAIVRRTLEVKDGEYEGVGTDGVARFYAVATVPEVDWVAYVGVPSQPIYQEATTHALMNSAIGLIVLLAIAGFALHLAVRIERPMLALAATARRLREGETHARATLEGPKEVAEVADEFNEMVDALQAAERSLRQLNADLERRVEQRTAELEKANRELETFSYSVSHDLRAPLRVINGFAEALLEDERPRLSEEGANMLERISSNAVKLGRLIEDILEYSRAGRQPLVKEPVDLDKLAVAVAEEICSGYPQSQVDVRLLPSVEGDLTMIRRIFENLIGNACKFSAGKEQPHIEVGAAMEHGVPVFYVRDNGVGFDMEHAGKLFGIFQRLHKDSDFPGTGVGLSIVKQLVERHGGRIWYESAPGQGTTFYFTLQEDA